MNNRKPIDCSPEAQARLLFDALYSLRLLAMDDSLDCGDFQKDMLAVKLCVDKAEREHARRFQAWHSIKRNGSTILWHLNNSRSDRCPYCLHRGLLGDSNDVRSCPECGVHISRPGSTVWAHCVADPYLTEE